MSPAEHAALTRLGWNDTLAASIRDAPPQAVPVRVIEQHRSEYRVCGASGERAARTQPLLHRHMSQQGDGIAVGDWALYVDDGRWLVQRLPRASLLERAREDGRRQRLVANVNTALLVMGLDGDYKPERLARYQQMTEASGVKVVIALTKADRVADADAQRNEIQQQAGAATPVLLMDPRAATTQALLAPYLQPGLTLALLGSSGVGKSTLMNTLLGTEVQRTGETQATDDLGRHTTTARSLRMLPGGACLIDTPGMREIKLVEEQVADDFADVRALTDACRFSDCQHQNEPGCAVIAAVGSERLAAYRDSLKPRAGKFRRGKAAGGV
ncbi:MAG: ribosome small subunit-dependent GTPase A [Polycyclovorans sp.]|nr:ribosome small subunit-dependent GTPase A [Polycyclovorans sp.]|tara:strand:+ start:2350 stop:3333 length:984 start_codon:yes stop_codon:yes gene_type:complete